MRYPKVQKRGSTALPINAAQLLRHDKELGTVAAGKLADVVAVPGNPVEDISVMKRVSL